MMNVIIPTYKARETLSKTLDSLVSQTKEMFLVTIVQDGDGEDYTDIINTYTDRGLHISLIQLPENVGPGMARQAGINASSQCDYIMFVDADDMLLPNAVDTLYSEAKRNSADIVISNFFMEKAHEPLMLLDSATTPVTWCHGKAYRTEFLTGNAICFLPSLRLNEDSYFNLVAVNSTDKVVRIPTPTYLWRDNQNSLTRGKNAASFFANSWDQYVLGQIHGLLKIAQIREKPDVTVTALTIKNIYEHIMKAIHQHCDREIPELSLLGQNAAFINMFQTAEFWTILQEHLKTSEFENNNLFFYKYRFCDWFNEYITKGIVK